MKNIFEFQYYSHSSSLTQCLPTQYIDMKHKKTKREYVLPIFSKFLFKYFKYHHSMSDTQIYIIQYLKTYYTFCTFIQKRNYNLTVQENLSEKEDELLQCSRWLRQSQATSTEQEGQKNPISPFTVDIGEEGREKYNSYYISQLLSGFMIYISDTKCYCAF